MNQTYGVGIIGMGHWYMPFNIARVLAEDSNCKLIAVSDPRPEKLKDFAQRFAIRDTYENYENLLTREDIDIVLVAPPTVKIPEYVVRAAEAGKHIIMGKPMAMTLSKADQALSAVKKAGVKLVAWEAMAKLGSRVSKNEIGNVASISTVMHQGIAEDWHHSGTPGWFADPSQVPGGAFIDEGIYTIEAHRFYAESEVKEVNYARTQNLVFRDLAVEDFGQAILTFKNNVSSLIEVGWTISQPTPKYYGRMTKANALNYTFITGTEGSVIYERRAPGLSSGKIDVLNNTYPHWITHNPVPEYFGVPTFNVLTHLIECIEQDKAPLLSGEDARKSLEVALAVYRSAATHKPVTLPLTS
jgi:predicted dehydrogenase